MSAHFGDPKALARARRTRASAFRWVERFARDLNWAQKSAKADDELRLWDRLDAALIEFWAADSAAMNAGAHGIPFIDATDPLFGLNPMGVLNLAAALMNAPSKAARGRVEADPLLAVALHYRRVKWLAKDIELLQEEAHQLDSQHVYDVRREAAADRVSEHTERLARELVALEKAEKASMANGAPRVALAPTSPTHPLRRHNDIAAVVEAATKTVNFWWAAHPDNPRNRPRARPAKPAPVKRRKAG